MGDLFYAFVKNSLGKALWHGKLIGSENLPKEGPAVFVANHSGSFGPIAIMSGVPVRFYTWISKLTVDFRTSADYLRKDFIEPELGFRRPFSTILSFLLSLAAVPFIRGLNVIPVFNQSKAIQRTMENSLNLLLLKKFILVFPEDPFAPSAGGMKPFQTGFLKLSEMYFLRTGKILSFYPVTVQSASGSIVIHPPVPYIPGPVPQLEKKRLGKLLEKTVRDAV